MNSDLRRFEHSIAGRPYLIEVAAVSRDRWRACIVSMPGVPTALMPFYGPTPDEAARHLSEWLTRAHERPAASPADARRAKADTSAAEAGRAKADASPAEALCPKADGPATPV